MSTSHRPAAASLVLALVAVAACADSGPLAPAPSPGQLALAASPAAPPPTVPNVYRFYDCVGPAGTPSSFRAEKIAVPPSARYEVAQASSFRLTDGSGVFVVLDFGAGRFNPPGIDQAGIATVTCKVAFSIGVLEYSGFLAPAR